MTQDEAALAAMQLSDALDRCLGRSCNVDEEADASIRYMLAHILLGQTNHMPAPKFANEAEAIGTVAEKQP